MNKFEIGDRVICVSDSKEYGIIDMTGIVVKNSGNDFIVEFDEDIGGHDGGGVGKWGHCLYLCCDEFDYLEDSSSEDLYTDDDIISIIK